MPSHVNMIIVKDNVDSALMTVYFIFACIAAVSLILSLLSLVPSPPRKPGCVHGPAAVYCNHWNE